MSRAALVPLGLAVNGLVFLTFAWAGLFPLEGFDRVLLSLEGLGVLVAAFGLRDWRAFASVGVVAAGLGLFAVAEAVHLALSIATGMAVLSAIGFTVFVGGSVVAAVGAWRWWRSLEAGSAVPLVRIGLLLVAGAYTYYLALPLLFGGASPAVTAFTVLSLGGMVAAAWALDPAEIEDDVIRGPGGAQPA